MEALTIALKRIFFEMYLNAEDMNPNTLYWGLGGDARYVEICMALDLLATEIFCTTFEDLIKGEYNPL